MNRNLSIFLGAVAVAAVGTFVGRALTDDDVANAAPRNFTITRQGSTAQVEVLCITKVTAADGGVAYDAAPQGFHMEQTPADDGGTNTERVSRSVASCRLPPADESRVGALFTGAGLVCYRRGVQLER